MLCVRGSTDDTGERDVSGVPVRGASAWGNVASLTAWVRTCVPAYLRTATVVAVATAMPLAASGLTGVANAAPPPPAGFTTIFVDDFNGPAGSVVDGTKWMHRIGTGYVGGAPNWGTGEIEYNTNSTANVYQDGAGRLAIKPIRDGAGNWTSGRLETQRTDLGAPAGGVMRVEAELKRF